MTKVSRTPLEQLAHDQAMRQMHLMERLCSALSAQLGGGIEVHSRRDERGRYCEYAVEGATTVDIDSVTGLRDERDRLAAEYYALTPIAPSKCMVVSWIDGLSARVEYEAKPDEWWAKEKAR